MYFYFCFLCNSMLVIFSWNLLLRMAHMAMVCVIRYL